MIPPLFRPIPPSLDPTWNPNSRYFGAKGRGAPDVPPNAKSRGEPELSESFRSKWVFHLRSLGIRHRLYQIGVLDGIHHRRQRVDFLRSPNVAATDTGTADRRNVGLQPFQDASQQLEFIKVNKFYLGHVSSHFALPFFLTFGSLITLASSPSASSSSVSPSS
jgi:hypothetical protein